MNLNFLLISVCEREICTELFESYQEAKDQMMYELVNWGGADEELLYPIEESQETSDFGYGEDYAWANNRENYDWKIIDLQEETEYIKNSCNNL